MPGLTGRSKDMYNHLSILSHLYLENLAKVTATLQPGRERDRKMFDRGLDGTFRWRIRGLESMPWTWLNWIGRDDGGREVTHLVIRGRCSITGTIGLLPLELIQVEHQR